MNRNDPRKVISKAIRERLAAGEKKTAIFAYLQSEFNADDISSRFLAQWPYPAEREKNKAMNHVLLAILALVAIVKIASAGIYIWHKIPMAIPMIFLVPLINIILIYQVARFNGMGYTLTILLGGAGVFKIWENGPETPSIEYMATTSALSALLLISVVLAEILRRRLLPNSTFFMRPKKNEDGSYKF